jgi:hypothetical protein
MRSSSRKAGLRAYDPNIKKWLVVAVVLTLPVVLSGCSGGFGVGSSASNPQGEFMQGSVVKGFPPVPAYPKAQIGETFGDGNVFGASLVSNDNLARVLDFYNKSLTLDGWETKLSQVSDTNYVFLIKNANYQGEIIVNTAADGKKTAITVNLNKREGIS